MDVGFYKKYFEVEKKHWLMRVRRSIIEDNLRRFFSANTSQTKILDFGCGSGIFVSELQEKGYDVHGVDISAEAIKFGELRGIKNLSIQDSHRLDFPDASFDVVLSLDVLEHLEDESWAIREVYRILKPGGKFMVMVPAYMFLWGVQDEVAHHYRRYTLNKLEKVISRNGDFKFIKSSYFNSFLFLPIAMVRLLSKHFRLKKRESDFDINTPLLDKIFFTIFNFERKLLRKIVFPFGVSILLISQKK